TPSARNSGDAFSATTSTAAAASASRAARRVATAPPPTTRTRRAVRSSNSGKPGISASSRAGGWARGLPSGSGHHARGYRCASRLVDEKESARRSVRGVGVNGEWLGRAQLDAADVVQRKLGRRSLVEGGHIQSAP